MAFAHTEPISGVNGTLDECKKGKDNPVLYNILSIVVLIN